MFKQIVEAYEQTGFLHHAYLIVGEREIIQPILVKTLAIIGEGNDTVWENYETFGIDASRELVARSVRRNWTGQREFIILVADRYTLEAQNALLKLFEEPRTGLHFFILSERITDFLPTLQSRLMIIDHQGKTQPKKSESSQDQKALKFLSDSPVNRLNFIVAELKREPTREDWFPLLNNLEKILHNRPTLDEKALTEITMVRRYLTDPASVPKLLFEHLALVLPVC